MAKAGKQAFTIEMDRQMAQEFERYVQEAHPGTSTSAVMTDLMNRWVHAQRQKRKQLAANRAANR